MGKIMMTLCMLGAMTACNNSNKTVWVVSTPDVSWEQQDTKGIHEAKAGSTNVEIDIARPLQTIDGFGSCFNELGWTSLSALNEPDRETILRELFAPGVGANFTVCRMPVGANDFSRDWYSYNETDGDFEMKNFSIANDRETLIPFIKSAQKYHPGLQLWASPWSPPTWMKDNRHYACTPLSDFFDQAYRTDIKPEQVRREGDNMFIQKDAYFKAYAAYFAKFIEAYRAENIPIFMVMPQNEFNSCQPFPSCTWRSAALNKFVGEYLGPKMEELGVALMFGTMERPNTLLADTLLRDPLSSKYIKGMGFQWGGKNAIEAIHRNYPQLKIYQTEQECGDGQNDWQMCVHSWQLMKHYFKHGASVYEYWNTSLEKGGMSRWGWRQNSLVTVNKKAKTYKFTYEYYLLKHASHYVLPGAQYLAASGTFTDLMAFKNADGSYVLILHNDSDKEIRPVIKLGDRTISAPLKPHSFNTIVL
jgi:glucosylceramidase